MKKHFVNVCLFSVLALGTVACNSDDNAPTEQVNPYEKFKGIWTGSFSGNTQGGNWTATFDTNGKAMGTLTTGNFTFDLEGQVSENGEITAKYKNDTTEVGTMTGTMTETTASGTWKSPLLNIEGTWEGSKN